jgi:hypothetical protein
MKLKTLFDKYPLMKVVWEECLVLHSQEGMKYRKVEQYWQTQSYKFYGEVVKFPSRTLLWQEAKHAGETQCPACEDYVPKEETEEIFIRKGDQGQWLRVCKECALRYQMLQKQKGHSTDLADYISVKRDPTYTTRFNPRDET